jgi:hypothetical protein
MQLYYNFNLRAFAGILFLTGIIPQSFWYIVIIPNIFYLSSIYIFYPLLDKKISSRRVFHIFLWGIFVSLITLSSLYTCKLWLSVSSSPDNYILINFAIPELTLYESIKDLFINRPKLFGPESIGHNTYREKINFAVDSKCIDNDIYLGHRKYSEVTDDIWRYFKRDDLVDDYHQILRNSKILSSLYYSESYREIYMKHSIISQEVDTFNDQINRLSDIAQVHSNVSDRSYLGEIVKTRYQDLAYPNIEPLCYTLKIRTAIEVGITSDNFFKVNGRDPNMKELLDFHYKELSDKFGPDVAKPATYRFGLTCQKLLQDENLGSPTQVGRRNSNNVYWKNIAPITYLNYLRAQKR